VQYKGSRGLFHHFFYTDTWVRRLFLQRIVQIQRLAFWLVVLLYPAFALLSWLRIGWRHLFGLKPAVLWAPTPILTIAESSEILRRLGYPSTTLVFTVYYITHNFDLNLQPLINNPAVNYWLPHALFLWALLKFDIFHFFYDGGLWSGMRIVPQAKWLELPLLRLAGKRIIASAYGADVRVQRLNEYWQPYNLCQECPDPGKHCICDTDRGATNAKYHRDWCNVLLAMGDMHDYVFKSRLDFNYWPIDVHRVPYVGAQPHAGPIKLVHSPNHRHFKGTRFIEAAVASLRAKGYDIELILVERVSNEEAKRMYAEADVVVAQCIAGWLGYTEIEAMAAGKPVIGYLRNTDYLAHSPGCPLVSANPATLEAVLEELVCDPDRRAELGRLGRTYIEREWSYEALAPRYDALHQSVWKHNRLRETLRAKWADFFDGESRYRVGLPLTGPTLGEWVVHSDPVLNLHRIASGIYGQPPFDAQGLPRMFYNQDYVTHPGVIALYALNLFHSLLVEPQETCQMRFAEMVRWLRDHLEIDTQGIGRWFYGFRAVGRELERQWVSCFSQSLGLSLLLRGEQLFPGEGFRQYADAAVKLFQVPVQEGGILWVEDGKVYLEEYPEPSPAHVLNGFVTGMFGLYEYYRVTGEEWTHTLFTQCVHTLSSILGQYEMENGLLRYDLRGKIAVNDDYNHFIVQQLRALHMITAERIFDHYARRWAHYLYRRKLDLFLSGQAPL
jgi:hypothetical protein